VKALSHFRDGDLARLGQADRETLVAAAAAVRELPKMALRSRSLAIRL